MQVSSIYARGKKLWCRLKDESNEWKSKPTPYFVGDEDKAKRYARTAQDKIDARRTTKTVGPQTVNAYAEQWLELRTNASSRDDKGRIRNHVLPRIGHMLMRDVRHRHIRDLVRELKATPDLAPRTVRNIYGVLGAMFREAVVDEAIDATPCLLKRGDLPAKVDKDPEWREMATFTIPEVVKLITDDRILVERRVQYAMKALAGLRHGEVAGLRWLHFNDRKPLGMLLVAHSYDGRTKTLVTRRVPVHKTLSRILKAWRDEHWPRVYGRLPTPADYIVPTRNMTSVDPTDAGRAFKVDLELLGLRVDAGQHRDRGGHDLRAWFITTCQEHGAHRDLLRVVTHTGKGDVVSGYTRATWPALCREVAKLRLAISDEKILRRATALATAERSAEKRWRKLATPTGFENVSATVQDRESAPNTRELDDLAN